MRFLVDAQLPPALARWLTQKGHESEHVMDCGLLAAADRVIWDYTVDNNTIIVTKDEDFALRRTLEDSGPVIVWLRIGNTRKAELLNWLEDLLPELLVALQRGEGLLEVS